MSGLSRYHILSVLDLPNCGPSPTHLSKGTTTFFTVIVCCCHLCMLCRTSAWQQRPLSGPLAVKLCPSQLLKLRTYSAATMQHLWPAFAAHWLRSSLQWLYLCQTSWLCQCWTLRSAPISCFRPAANLCHFIFCWHDISICADRCLFVIEPQQTQNWRLQRTRHVWGWVQPPLLCV